MQSKPPKNGETKQTRGDVGIAFVCVWRNLYIYTDTFLRVDQIIPMPNDYKSIASNVYTVGRYDTYLLVKTRPHGDRTHTVVGFAPICIISNQR